MKSSSVSSALTLPSLTTTSSSSSSTTTTTTASLVSNSPRFRSPSLINKKWPLTSLPFPPHYSNVHRPLSLPVLNVGDKRTEVATSARTEADDIVDGLDFGELCDEFECISSPLVESTARQLARDILELRQDNRAFDVFAVSVRYKDPVRSFTGREIYKRPLWITTALENPSVSVQEMTMQSTNELTIKWTIKGKPKSIIGSVSGDLIVKMTSKFTLNQISGQVIEHQETWDLSASSPLAQVFFWTSRRLYATKEAAKDLAFLVNNSTTRTPPPTGNFDMYQNPIGDPTKFFQRDDDFLRDAYQIALFLAVLYFVVQFLKQTL